MKKELSSLQEWLIALALFIIVPTTVYLGCNLLGPKIDHTSYWKSRNEFFTEYSCKDPKKCAEREVEWKQTVEFKAYSEKQCKQSFIYLMIAGPLSCALVYAGTLFVMPVVAPSLIMTSLVLIAMYGYSYKICSVKYGIGLLWFELLFVLINLIVVLSASYRLSERK